MQRSLSPYLLYNRRSGFFFLARHYSKSASISNRHLKMDAIQTNPYFSKYACKLKEMQKSAPHEFDAKVQELQKVKQQAQQERAKDIQEEKERLKALQTKPKSLSDVMKFYLLEEKSKEDIAEIWTKFHSHKQSVFAVINKEEFDIMYPRFQAFPLFVHAIPRAQGYELFFQQFDGTHCYFTPLAFYQVHKENAPPCLTLYHFTELLDSKGVVLMNSDINTDVISVYEAQCLALSLKMYYGINAGLKLNFVRTFNVAPATFRYEDVIREFEKYKQDFAYHESEGTRV